MVSVKLHKYIYVYTAYVRICRVIWVNNKLLAGRKCDISLCTADIFKHRDYLVRGKSVFSYCGIILLTRPDYTFSRRATFSPDAFITAKVDFWVFWLGPCKNLKFLNRQSYTTEDTSVILTVTHVHIQLRCRQYHV